MTARRRAAAAAAAVGVVCALGGAAAGAQPAGPGTPGDPADPGLNERVEAGIAWMLEAVGADGRTLTVRYPAPDGCQRFERTEVAETPAVVTVAVVVSRPVAPVSCPPNLEPTATADVALGAALGGRDLVHAPVQDLAGTGARTGGRLAGPDRVATAVAVARRAFPDGAAVAYLARADQPADAVAGGALTDGPVLLVPSCGPLPAVVADELGRLGPAEVIALGGETAVADHVLRQAIAGTSDAAASCSGEPGPVADGVELAVRDVGGGRFELLVTNRRTGPIETGRSYRLERRGDAGFAPVQPAVGPFTDEALVVEPGRTLAIGELGPTVVQDGQQRTLEPGEYRVVLNVEGLTLTAGFTAG